MKECTCIDSLGDPECPTHGYRASERPKQAVTFSPSADPARCIEQLVGQTDSLMVTYARLHSAAYQLYRSAKWTTDGISTVEAACLWDNLRIALGLGSSGVTGTTAKSLYPELADRE